MSSVVKCAEFLLSLLTSDKPDLWPRNTLDFNEFIRFPMAYAKNSRSEVLSWPARRSGHLPEIYFSFEGEQIAYIHGVYLSIDDSTARISHFATEAGMERRGIGRAVATAFFTELNKKYEIETLIFSEISTRYHEVYPPFFKRIGAQPIVVPNQDIPDWHWSYSKLV